MIFLFYFLCEFKKHKSKQNVQDREGKERTEKNQNVFCEKQTFKLSNVGYEVYETLIHRPEDVLQ